MSDAWYSKAHVYSPGPGHSLAQGISVQTFGKFSVGAEFDCC